MWGQGLGFYTRDIRTLRGMIALPDKFIYFFYLPLRDNGNGSVGIITGKARNAGLAGQGLHCPAV